MKKEYGVFVKIVGQPLKTIMTLKMDEDKSIGELLQASNAILKKVVISVGIIEPDTTYLSYKPALKEVALKGVDIWQYVEDGDYFVGFPNFSTDLQIPINIVACVKEKPYSN